MKRISVDEQVADKLTKKGQKVEEVGSGGMKSIKRDEHVSISIRTDGTYINASSGQVRVQPDSIKVEIEGIGEVDVIRLISEYEDLHTESKNEDESFPGMTAVR
jgi:hypothetical protein